METGKKVLTYTLYFAGLFGRNRKAKKSHVKLTEVPVEGGPVAEVAIRELVAKAIQEIKPKGALNIAVVESEETIETRTYNGVTMTSRSFALFGGKTLFKETVS